MKEQAIMLQIDGQHIVANSIFKNIEKMKCLSMIEPSAYYYVLNLCSLKKFSQAWNLCEKIIETRIKEFGATNIRVLEI